MTSSTTAAPDLKHASYSYIKQSRTHELCGRVDAAWACLEAAHVLGQRITRLHVRAHAAMWGMAWRRRDMKDIVAQTLRIAAAALLTWVWVPAGNTGRSNLSAFKEMPLPDDLLELLTDRDKSR